MISFSHPNQEIFEGYLISIHIEYERQFGQYSASLSHLQKLNFEYYILNNATDKINYTLKIVHTLNTENYDIENYRVVLYEITYKFNLILFTYKIETFFI